jgi:enoyl-CoA hydratase/carnithine racemase
MEYQTLTYETIDNYALVTLNRPDRLNAWTRQMAREQLDAFARANADPGIGAVVMTGAGRGFCAGADIGEVFDAPAGEDDASRRAARAEEAGVADSWVRVVRESKPLIAAVNGPAVGVGLSMILPFDVIIASEAARFSMMFVKMGVTPELASSHFLVQRVGWGRASELCLSGRTLEGEEAVRLGLADYLAPPENLLEQAGEVASRIAANPGPALRGVKALLTANGSETDIDAITRREGEVLAEAQASPEHREAVKAFLEKRRPDFRNLS